MGQLRERKEETSRKKVYGGGEKEAWRLNGRYLC